MKTTTTFKLSALLLCATLFTTSCKDNSAYDEMAGPSAASFKDMRAKTLTDLTQKKDFKIEDGITFTSSKGAKLQIQPNCLRLQNGSPATGNATLSFIEIYDRGNMVMANKPVMGINGVGKKEPLITGGQYNIKIMQGDQELKSGCMFNVSIPASNTGTLDAAMKLWNGNIDQDGNLAWEEVKGQGKEAGMNINTDMASYSIWGTEFGWTNVDRFASFPDPKTQIKVKVPAGYNKDNAAIYLAYQDQPNLLAQLDTYDKVDHFFSEHYGFVPVGMTLHVIFVSESNGAVAHSIKQVTVAANSVITFTEQELSVGTKAQVQDKINKLK